MPSSDATERMGCSLSGFEPDSRPQNGKEPVTIKQFLCLASARKVDAKASLSSLGLLKTAALQPTRTSLWDSPSQTSLPRGVTVGAWRALQLQRGRLVRSGRRDLASTPDRPPQPSRRELRKTSCWAPCRGSGVGRTAVCKGSYTLYFKILAPTTIELLWGDSRSRLGLGGGRNGKVSGKFESSCQGPMASGFGPVCM